VDIPDQQLPIGQAIPALPHAVSASLPTLDSVVLYEEKDPALFEQMRQGYPRFVDHHYVRAWEAELTRRFGLEGQEVFCLCSNHAAKELQRFVGFSAVTVLAEAAYAVVGVKSEPELVKQARLFMQHTGLRISSREAEDLLVEAGLLKQAEEESSQEDDHEALHDYVTEQWGARYGEDVMLSNSGMSAVYAAFSALDGLQRAKGRKIWIQLGWLYVDTIKILSSFTGENSHRLFIPDATDLCEVEGVLARWGDQIAGIFTEAPTNPLLRTVDLEGLSALARKHGVALVVDPSTASILNVDVLPYADVGVCSLTKYIGYTGDVLMGSVALNDASPFYEDLKGVLPALVEPPYVRDVRRLAGNLAHVDEVVSRINENTMTVAKYLENHDAVTRVFWAGDEAGASAYKKIAKDEDCPGGLITFDLRGHLGRFYDALRISKGPSFGMACSLACPFLYMAHYDLVSTMPGRAALMQFGLNPDLVRISVGAEPVEQILAALDEALKASGG